LAAVAVVALNTPVAVAAQVVIAQVHLLRQQPHILRLSAVADQ
jgi:hypothetical protein